ncbi:uncharacterized protein LOC113498671 [Trichoplusia ni]|uniref:Uncharacterized protein LOC113498671 n=1 Tax=Trichoplusia ni TaxID=7111 RepID=A0A7E5W238_TRINI|nr:uncharacterized protein LOC113498671 [Trichoplusia ni]
MKPLFSIVVAVLVVAATAHPQTIEFSRTFQSKPKTVVRTEEIVEGCSSEKGCASIKKVNGAVVEKFGNLQVLDEAAKAGVSKTGFQGTNQLNSPFKAGGIGGGSFSKISKTSTSYTSSSSSGSGGVGLAANPGLNFGSGQSKIDITTNQFLNGKAGFETPSLKGAPQGNLQGTLVVGSTTYTGNQGLVSQSGSVTNQNKFGATGFGSNQASNSGFGSNLATKTSFGSTKVTKTSFDSTQTTKTSSGSTQATKTSFGSENRGSSGLGSIQFGASGSSFGSKKFASTTSTGFGSTVTPKLNIDSTVSKTKSRTEFETDAFSTGSDNTEVYTSGVRTVFRSVHVPVGCSAALKCTPIEFCTAGGVISNTSVVLTKHQQTYRVPLTDCKDPESGNIGKCCRDPFYIDPWPVNVIGKWVPNIFGEKPWNVTDRPPTTEYFPETTPTPGYYIERNKNITIERITTEEEELVESETRYRVYLEKYTGDGTCGLQYPQKPYGNRKELELDFAEIPWQAMILLKTDKSLLCGGAIVQPNVVMTTGSCVKG